MISLNQREFTGGLSARRIKGKNGELDSEVGGSMSILERQKAEVERTVVAGLTG